MVSFYRLEQLRTSLEVSVELHDKSEIMLVTNLEVPIDPLYVYVNFYLILKVGEEPLVPLYMYMLILILS